MKNGLVSKILSGGLAAAMVFSVFSPSVFADQDLYDVLRGNQPSIEALERVLKEHAYIDFIDYNSYGVRRSPLLFALKHSHPFAILEWLLNYERTIWRGPNRAEYRACVLNHTVNINNSEFLRFLFDEKLINEDDVNRMYDLGYTSFQWAAYLGWLEGVQLLYKNGASVDLRSMYVSTPVYLAARNGHAGVVRFLVEECNADFNIASKNGHTAVSIAAGFGQLEVVKWFIESGHVTLDYRDGKGRSLLEVAKKQEWGVTPERSEKTAAVAAYLESIGAVE